MFTREQIDSIEPGMMLVRKNGERRNEPARVVSIFAKKDDVAGRLFVCGYAEFGANAQMSFSIKEGDAYDFSAYELAPAQVA